MIEQAEIYGAITRERDYQTDKWGTLEEHPHEVGGWIAIMQKELNEALAAWCSKRGDEAALREILQVIATGVACLEQHGVVERGPDMPKVGVILTKKTFID